MIYIILCVITISIFFIYLLYIKHLKYYSKDKYVYSNLLSKLKNIFGLEEYESDEDYEESIFNDCDTDPALFNQPTIIFKRRTNVLIHGYKYLTQNIIDEFIQYSNEKIKSAPNFGVLLNNHIDNKRFNGPKELLIKAGIPSSTLNDLINKQTITKKKLNLYRICLTLQLSFADSKELFESKGFTFCSTSLYELCFLFFIETKLGRKYYSDELLDELLKYYDFTLI